jgi:hypothetical protein
MTLEFREESGGKILAVRVSGKLTKADYERFVPETERLIRRYRKDSHPVRDARLSRLGNRRTVDGHQIRRETLQGH